MSSMRCPSARAILAVFALLAGCGGGGDGDDGEGPDVVGDYQVTSHRENHAQGGVVSCSDPGPEIQPGDPGHSPYFTLAVDDFFDDPDFLVFQVCDGPGSGCTDTLIHLERTGDRFESISANTQEGESTCSLYAGRSALSLDGDVVTVEDRGWSEFDRPLSDCSVDAAEALIETPDCRDVVVWVGTRL
jgi:hypothetical protein